VDVSVIDEAKENSRSPRHFSHTEQLVEPARKSQSKML